MVMPSDKEYKATKQIKLGQAAMSSDFEELALYVEKMYGVKPLNIIYDTMYDKSPRLMICFELAKDASKFRDGNGNFDTGRQKDIADKFRSIVRLKESTQKKGLFGFWQRISSTYRTNNTFVYFAAFEPIAKIEANENLTKSDIEIIQRRLDVENIWLISPMFSGITFFVYTNEQLKRYEDSSEKRQWADAYFDVLERYNEFGYFKRERFGVALDSKQNFDENYSSNWYYYYK